MSTPICDFVKEYAERNAVRFHMPGHKGKKLLGFEKFDITEIDGADNLFAPRGIIAESEENAGRLFGCKTFYSAGGSTLCIQAMLHLTALYAFSKGKTPFILAGRNAHKAFVNACALLGIDIGWLFPEGGAYHSCVLTPQKISEEIEKAKREKGEPTAVYITSPDYLGNMADIEGMSAVCKKNGVLLCVDNAHGAYLRFLPRSCHPIDLGADICCDSAHKTLPALTGAAYLHIGKTAPQMFFERAVSSLSLFASSSPSYLILQSLDAVNEYLPEFQKQLSFFLPEVQMLKKTLSDRGFTLVGDERLKLTVAPKSFGYTGCELARILEKENIFPEFYDPDFLVLMLAPLCGKESLEKLENVLLSLSNKPAIKAFFPPIPRPERVLSVREAIFKDSEELPVSKCGGRICASAAISCPPAVPLVVCGERIDSNVIESFHYYGIESCRVVKDSRCQMQDARR